jgi:hypothetical protein
MTRTKRKLTSPKDNEVGGVSNLSMVGGVDIGLKVYCTEILRPIVAAWLEDSLGLKGFFVEAGKEPSGFPI